MFEKSQIRLFATVAAAAMLATMAQAMTINLVPVGNPGNAGERAGGWGPDRICGAVDYAYNIGKYEVSNAEYTEFLNAADLDGSDPYDLYSSNMGSGKGGITYTAGNPNGSKYDVRAGRGNMPVNYVSFWDASRFANWLHNGQGSGDTETGAYTLTPDGIANNTVTRNLTWLWAVTSEDEWYKAAYYDGGSGVYYDYPTGRNSEPTAEAPPGTDVTNGSASFHKALGDLTDVGAYDAKPSDSPYGTFDQGGNVWERNEEVFSGSDRGIRGGSYDGNTGADLWASNRGNFPDAAGEYEHVGFRVANIPEPGSITLLVCGTLGLLAYGWRRRRR